MTTTEETKKKGNRNFKRTVLTTDQMNELYRPLEEIYGDVGDAEILRKAMRDAKKFYQVRNKKIAEINELIIVYDIKKKELIKDSVELKRKE